MKSLVVLTAAAVAASLVTAKADFLANWTFESSGLGSSTPSFAPGANTPSTNFFAEQGLQAGTAAAFGLHVTAATYTSPAGNGSAKSLSANNWSVGDYYEFSFSTLGYQALSVSFDENGSATGPANFKLTYSTDGSTFNDVVGATYTIPSGVTWSSGSANPLGNTSFSFDLSAITALDNISGAFLRIVDTSTTSINGGTVGTGGTGRVDNFVVSAAAVPEPASLALGLFGGFAWLLALRRKH